MLHWLTNVKTKLAFLVQTLLCNDVSFFLYSSGFNILFHFYAYAHEKEWPLISTLVSSVLFWCQILFSLGAFISIYISNIKVNILYTVKTKQKEGKKKIPLQKVVKWWKKRAKEKKKEKRNYKASKKKTINKVAICLNHGYFSVMYAIIKLNIKKL